jgi:uncharacterized protein YcfJ
MLPLIVLAKQASSVFGKSPGSATVEDLRYLIENDPALSPTEKRRLLGVVDSAPGTGRRTLSGLPSTLLGGVLGNLIARYFGQSFLRQLLSTAAGALIGSVLGRSAPEPRRFVF